MNSYPSRLFEQAVNEFSRLPGIGNKSALRMVLFLLRQDKTLVKNFGEIISRLPEGIMYCRKCYNIAETELCEICNNPQRDSATICIVENARDVIAIERTQQYKGLYHVLGGVISPVEGIGPSQLTIDSLISKVDAGEIKEVIMALNANMEGDTTAFYLYKKLAPFSVRVSSIARGVSIGGELEFTDEITLGRSIVNRTPYESLVT
ncbi:MAG: recombination protein RecR [Bacteroidetes bacterium]|nr:recombination protein RecR [Bacteroidota bacterium]